eukprot:8144323-Alexandrium_andersonii.AAC.1
MPASARSDAECPTVFGVLGGPGAGLGFHSPQPLLHNARLSPLMLRRPLMVTGRKLGSKGSAMVCPGAPS